MKKKIILISSLFLVVGLISQITYTHWKGSKVSNQAVIHEQDWEISPIFKVGESTMVGEPSKIGILDTAFTAGKQKGVHWFLWGEQEDLVKRTFKLMASTQGTKPITVVENYGIAYGSNGAEAQVPTLLTIPFPGLWKFDAFVDDEKYGSIIIRVPD